MTPHSFSRAVRFGVVAALTYCALLISTRLVFADWPQWGGADRDFHIKTSPLIENWSVRKPVVLWRRPFGDGYSSPIVVKDRIYSMYREGDDEIVACLAAGDGKTVWEKRYTSKVPKGDFASKYGFGPRSTPLLHDGRVFSIGFNGTMLCLDASDGREIWRLELLGEFEGNTNRWGYACSPLEYDGGIIAFVGGKGESVVCLDQKTGGVRWRRHDFKNSYASPIIIDVNGQSQMICFMTKLVMALDPKNGDLYWSYPHENQWDNNIVTPVLGGKNELFVTSEGNGGSRLLNIATNGKSVRERWHDRKLKVSHRNVIRIEDTLYFSHGDFGPKAFVAINAADGAVLWRRRDIPKAGLVRIGDGLLMLGEDGHLMTADVSREEAQIHCNVPLLGEPAWTIPTVVDERVYLRDRREMVAVELRLAPVGSLPSFED